MCRLVWFLLFRFLAGGKDTYKGLHSLHCRTSSNVVCTSEFICQYFSVLFLKIYLVYQCFAYMHVCALTQECLMLREVRRGQIKPLELHYGYIWVAAMGAGNGTCVLHKNSKLLSCWAISPTPKMPIFLTKWLILFSTSGVLSTILTYHSSSHNKPMKKVLDVPSLLLKKNSNPTH